MPAGAKLNYFPCMQNIMYWPQIKLLKTQLHLRLKPLCPTEGQGYVHRTPTKQAVRLPTVTVSKKLGQNAEVEIRIVSVSQI